MPHCQGRNKSQAAATLKRDAITFEYGLTTTLSRQSNCKSPSPPPLAHAQARLSSYTSPSHLNRARCCRRLPFIVASLLSTIQGAIHSFSDQSQFLLFIHFTTFKFQQQVWTPKSIDRKTTSIASPLRPILLLRRSQIASTYRHSNFSPSSQQIQRLYRHGPESSTPASQARKATRRWNGTIHQARTRSRAADNNPFGRLCHCVPNFLGLCRWIHHHWRRFELRRRLSSNTSW